MPSQPAAETNTYASLSLPLLELFDSDLGLLAGPSSLAPVKEDVAARI